MSLPWWILIVLCWMLIPAALLLKAYFDRRQAKLDAELERAVNEWLRRDEWLRSQER